MKCSHLILIPKTQENGPWNTMVFAVKCLNSEMILILKIQKVLFFGITQDVIDDLDPKEKNLTWST